MCVENKRSQLHLQEEKGYLLVQATTPAATTPSQATKVVSWGHYPLWVWN